MRFTQADYLNHLAKSRKVMPADVDAAAVLDEESLHNQILSYCKGKGWIALHGRMDRISNRSLGEPDFVILADGGRVFFVEVKTKTGKLSREQAGMQIWAAKLGHKIAVVRSFEAFLELTKEQKTLAII
jgi:Holliday junction resolvase-like predicted endonuclease